MSTRDYDALVAERPATTPVQLSVDGELRTINIQLWHWRDESSEYELTHLQVRELAPQHWVAASRTTTYRAWLRSELTTLATDMGLRDVRWLPPEDSGFFQQVMLARV